MKLSQTRPESLCSLSKVKAFRMKSNVSVNHGVFCALHLELYSATTLVPALVSHQSMAYDAQFSSSSGHVVLSFDVHVFMVMSITITGPETTCDGEITFENESQEKEEEVAGSAQFDYIKSYGSSRSLMLQYNRK